MANAFFVGLAGNVSWVGARHKAMEHGADVVAQARVRGGAMRALGLVAVPVSDAEQAVEVRCRLTREVPAGALVRLVGDSLRSVTSGFLPRRVTASTGQGAAPWVVRGGRLERAPLQSGADQGPRQILLLESPGAPDGLPVGATVVVAGTLRPGQPAAGVAIVFRLEVAPDGAAPTGELGDGADWQPASDWCGLLYVAGLPDHLEAFVNAAGEVGVATFDAWTNPVPAEPARGRPAEPARDRPATPARDRPADAAAPVVLDAPVREASGGETYAAWRIALAEPPAVGSRVTVRAAGKAGWGQAGRAGRGQPAGWEVVSSPAPPRRTPEGDCLLFGEFHWHTGASGDGVRPLDDAYEAARDGLLLDFAGAADHFPFERDFPLSAAADIADAFEAPGRFATLLGVELSWRMAHYNFYWADRAELDRFQAAWAARRPGPAAGTVFAPDIAAFYGLPPAYLDRAEPARLLVIPHHPNVMAQFYTVNGLPVWTHYHWPLGHYAPHIFRLGEIVQGRGCFECEQPDAAWHVRSGAGGGSLRTGLARGFRVGFTGGTDNHSGWPGRSTRASGGAGGAGQGQAGRTGQGQAGRTGQGQAGSPGSGWAGLTAVYAPEHSRAGIMRGLYRRRCYATTGARIVLDFRLNGAPMGSELALFPLDERRLALRVHGTAPLERVEVVLQGAVVASLPADGPDLVTEWVDDRRGRPMHDAYYYLRVRQQDGHCAWSSPIWVDLALPPEGPAAYGGPVAWA